MLATFSLFRQHCRDRPALIGKAKGVHTNEEVVFLLAMVTGIDEQGKIRLSRQAVLEGWTVEEAQAHDRRGSGGPRSESRGGPRGRGDRGDRPHDGSRGAPRGGPRPRR